MVSIMYPKKPTRIIVTLVNVIFEALIRKQRVDLGVDWSRLG